MAERAETIYARSLFETANEADILEEIKAGLDVVSESFSQNPDFVKLLASPAVPKTEKFGMLDAVFGGKLPIYLDNFFKILAQNGRISCLSGIKAEFDALYFREKNILAVTAVTAVELSAPLREKLCKRLEEATGKTVWLTEKVDPSVLGGILLRYDNKELDGTVRQRLNRLRQMVQSSML